MARDFNGTTDKIEYGHLGALDGTAKVTISLWINPGTGGSSFGSVFSQFEVGANNGFNLANNGTDETSMFCSFRNGANSRGVIPAGNITAGVWNHIHVVYDGTQASANDRVLAWVDGSQVTLTYTGASLPTTLPTITDNVLIGAVGTLFWDGSIAEVALWEGVTISDAGRISALAAGYSPLLVHGAPNIYAPLIRSSNERAGNIGSPTETGTTAVDHPPIAYPAPLHTITAPAAVSGLSIPVAMHSYRQRRAG